LAVASDQPTFQDVPSSDPDFGVIQGLANAGLIPSPLSGDSTVVTFRPNTPLTREEMILWKVPVDLRQALPNATIEAVQQSWGFQDAARIDPKALRAVLADYQNGDLANIRRAFGYTTLFQPKKAATRAEAAAALWFFGLQADGISAKDALQTSQGQTQEQTQGQTQGQAQGQIQGP
ncbi:MAG TPA: S-layer homology domain-containing protein, partial [Allocoleopsis sp.]